MSAQEIEIRLVPSLAEIGQAEWDACACPEAAEGGPPVDPFTTYRFLSALEESGSVG
ncbi:MAG: GNAT family N-acetyltransferase, partial [Sulfitobacter sp.]|nr:GNAT family N-acetyltransferase [Sulfitobacter sp.]